MHIFLQHLAQATTTTTTSGSKSSGSNYFFLVIIGLFVVVYLLVLRPRQQKMRQQQAAAKKLAVGDEVMSAGGIYGRVVSLGDDQVDVEVSPGVILSFVPRAVSLRPGAVSQAQAEDAPWDKPEPEAGPGEDTPDS